jgi:hypothetical protein
MWDKDGKRVVIETDTIKARKIDLLRGMSYLFAILSYLQDEPLCKSCITFLESLDAAKEKFLPLEKFINKKRDMPEEIRKLLTAIYGVLADLRIPDNPVRQKKIGHCALTSEFCFAKSALLFYEKIEDLTCEKEGSRDNG